jgi:hypothetical protein
VPGIEPVLTTPVASEQTWMPPAPAPTPAAFKIL